MGRTSLGQLSLIVASQRNSRFGEECCWHVVVFKLYSIQYLVEQVYKVHMCSCYEANFGTFSHKTHGISPSPKSGQRKSRVHPLSKANFSAFSSI